MAETRTYDVPGISCGHCKESIEHSLGGLSGIDSVDVDVDAKTVRVVGPITDDAVRVALDDIGYEITGVR